LSPEVEEIFRAAGEIRESHFEQASGLHSGTYWEKFRVLGYLLHAEPLFTMITQRFESKGGPGCSPGSLWWAS